MRAHLEEGPETISQGDKTRQLTRGKTKTWLTASLLNFPKAWLSRLGVHPCFFLHVLCSSNKCLLFSLPSASSSDFFLVKAGKDLGFRPSGLAVRTPGQGTKPAAAGCCLLQATVPCCMSPESVFLLSMHSRLWKEDGKSRLLPCQERIDCLWVLAAGRWVGRHQAQVEVDI